MNRLIEIQMNEQININRSRYIVGQKKIEIVSQIGKKRDRQLDRQIDEHKDLYTDRYLIREI